MKPQEFFQRFDEPRVIAAIQEAERRTSGQIRVFISSRSLAWNENIFQRATSRFEKLGLRRTLGRNAVLLYFMPRSRQFAVIGDTAIHDKCGDSFWQEVAAGLSQRLKNGQFTEAAIEAVKHAGDGLARHFPPEDGRDELPNAVGHD